MHRRAFLKTAVTILVARGQVWRAFAADRAEVPDGPAFELWKNWNADSQEGPLALVHAAILSANAFNTQPWRFRVTESQIDVYADTSRNLGAFDPYLRELFFSLGCALENLCVAGAANGIRTSPHYVAGKLLPPSGKPELAVRVALDHAPKSKSGLFAAIPHRHTNRYAFDATREVPSTYIRDLMHASREDDVRLFLYTSDSDRRAITDIIWNASKTLMSDPEVQRGTAPWYRATLGQLQKSRDGAYLGDPDPKSYVDLMLSGRLFGLIAVRDRYDRAQTIRAGRVWQRAHLLATARGLAARPANGAVESIDHERQRGLEPQSAARLATITGEVSWQPTFMFYMGYPTVAATASARRAMGEVLVR